MRNESTGNFVIRNVVCDRLPIDGVGKCFSHFEIVEDLMIHIEDGEESAAEVEGVLMTRFFEE